MKKSLSRGLILAAVIAMLMAALAPGASAKSRGGGELLTAAPAESKHEICILEGANICPPEPFEHIAICITTSMLAGTECPHVHEDDGDDGIGKLARAPRGDSQQAALPQGDCVGVNACNNFISDCIAAGGDFDEEHHNPQGQPNLGSCKPATD